MIGWITDNKKILKTESSDSEYTILNLELVEAVFTILFIKYKSVWKGEMVMDMDLLLVPVSGIKSLVSGKDDNKNNSI